MTFYMERWENNSWGLHNIERAQISGTVAVSADGSRANYLEATHYKHYLIPDGKWTLHSIYLWPDNVAYEVDDKTQTTTLWHCTCTWEEASPPAPDQDCRAAAEARLGHATRIGAAVIAGTPVIRYGVADSEEAQSAAFAPQFGCDLFEESRTTYNWIGIPTSRFHFVVRSYVAGEPNPEALRPPLGYLIREKPL